MTFILVNSGANTSTPEIVSSASSSGAGGTLVSVATTRTGYWVFVFRGRYTDPNNGFWLPNQTSYSLVVGGVTRDSDTTDARGDSSVDSSVGLYYAAITNSGVTANVDFAIDNSNNHDGVFSGTLRAIFVPTPDFRR
jgi:hypothetical protein